MASQARAPATRRPNLSPVAGQAPRHPAWVRELLLESTPAREAVAEHDAWRLMREGTIGRPLHRMMLVGFWPLIERFPHFLALNILKTTHGRHPGVDAARVWLARNLRTEARHAEWYLDWAAALGLSRREVLDGERPAEMTAIADWCWQVCHAGELVEGMAATNFAVEGVTGEWVRGVATSEPYRRLLAGNDAETASRWLAAHADYDASHPVEALDIIVQLVGAEPPAERVRAIRHAVLKSYELYRLALDAAQAHAGTP